MLKSMGFPHDFSSINLLDSLQDGMPRTSLESKPQDAKGQGASLWGKS